ncbi:RDD family protein [Nocardioides speluncae]|uniref:RDD family protein n=1 Tax=Nocardioides speluncae TaxID=2670337 RepID=UPI000D68C88E|nr:RDD family protein [Nocardioides speluncae]
MTDLALPSAGATFPAAELDRRFYAFVIDRLTAWSLYAVAAWAAWLFFIEPGDLWIGVGVIAGAVLLTGLGFSIALGAKGTSPGKAAMGLRTVHHGTGTPIGVGSAIVRTFVLGAAGLPTFGLGVATLAWTAVMDAGRQRRGWHDHVAHSIVVDIRPEPEVVEEEESGPRHIVNLTAMRLVPAAQPQATHVEAPPRAPVERTPTNPAGPVLEPVTTVPPASQPYQQPVQPPTQPVRPAQQPVAPPTQQPTQQPTRQAPPVPPVQPAQPVQPPQPVQQPTRRPVQPVQPQPTQPVRPPAEQPAARQPAQPVQPPAQPAQPRHRAQPSTPPAPVQPNVAAPAVPPPPVQERTTSRTTSRAAANAGSRWRVTFDTGESFLVEGLGLVGRRPEGRAGEPVQHVVPLPSSDMSLSKTHAQFHLASDGVLVVMDRGSTNGSILIRQGVNRDLTAGRPATLVDGDKVMFGDREMRVSRE